MADKETVKIDVDVTKDKTKTLSFLSGTLTKAKNIFFKMHTLVLSIGVAAVALATLAINAWKKQEAAINSLTQTLINSGIFTRELSKSYQDLARSLQSNSNFTEDNILSTISLLQSYIGQEKVTRGLLTSVLDLATSQKIDLKSAADQVGKSLGTLTNGLSTYGVIIDPLASVEQKIANATELLTIKFGGQSKSQAKGLGAFDVLKNVTITLLGILGQLLSPIVILFSKKATTFADDMSERTATFDFDLTVASKGLILVAVAIKNVSTAAGRLLFSFINTQMTIAKNIIKRDFKAVGKAIKDQIKLQINLVVGIREGIDKDTRILIDLFSGIQKQEFSKEKLIAAETRRQQVASDNLRNEDIVKEIKKQALEELVQLTKADIERLKGRLISIDIRIEAEKDKTKRRLLLFERRMLSKEFFDEKREQSGNFILLFGSL